MTAQTTASHCGLTGHTLGIEKNMHIKNREKVEKKDKRLANWKSLLQYSRDAHSSYGSVIRHWKRVSS